MLFTTLILGSLSAISLAVAIPDDDGCKGKTKTVTTTTLNTIISTQTISSLVTTSVTLTTTTTDSITTTATESITVTTTTTSASITTVTAVPSTFPTPVAYGSGCFYLIGAPTYLTGPDFPSAEHGCIAACNGEYFGKFSLIFSTLNYANTFRLLLISH